MKKIQVFVLLLLIAGAAFSEGPMAPFDEVALLKEWVSISSGTEITPGVNQVQEKVSTLLKSVGFSVEYYENPLNSKDAAARSGKQLVATLLSKNLSKKDRFITLIAHADTVFEKLNPFEVSADGLIAKGSGVSDDKGGIVVGVSALTTFLKMNEPGFSIRFIVSPSEETGSAGFEANLRKFSKDSVLILGLEPARENGSVIKSRKGIRWYDIEVAGKEAHAGVDHENGINACHELAVKLDRLQRLTSYKIGNTVSIGRIEGGKNKFNIVCGKASAKVDVRFSDPTRGEELFKAIDKILNTPSVESHATHEKAKTTFQISVNDPPFFLLPKAKPLLTKYLSILKEVEGKDFHGEATGGSADVNMMANAEVPILDGLGPIGGGYHTSDEFVVLSSLKTRAETLAKFLKYADQSIK